MGYTMEQRLRKQQLVRASREITRLTASTRKIELEERGVVAWIFERLIAYSKALDEAQKAGKLTREERRLLFDADGVTRLFTSYADFWHCLCETRPEIERLGLFDSMTDGKGLQLYEPPQETGAETDGSMAADIIPI